MDLIQKNKEPKLLSISVTPADLCSQFLQTRLGRPESKAFYNCYSWTSHTLDLDDLSIASVKAANCQNKDSY